MRANKCTALLPFVVFLTLSATVCGWCGTLLSDDFSKNNIGSTWTVVDDPSPSGASAWAMGNGVLTQTSNIYRTDREYEFWQGTHILAGNSSWKNYEFSAIYNSGDDDGWGVIVRYQDKNNYYRFITVADGGNRGPFRRLEKFVDGERSVLAENKDSFQVGKDYKIKLAVDGSKLTLWIDGKKALTADDSTFASGKIGLLTYANSGFSAKNVLVTGADADSSPANGAIGWKDDFSSNTIDSKWTVVDDPSPSQASAWAISGGALTQNSNIYRTDKEYEFWQGTHIVAGTSTWDNYDFSADCTSGDDDGWGMIIRYQNKNNYYRFITVADSGNRGPFRRLEKFVDGQRTVLAEDTNAFQPSKNYNMKFTADGTKLTVFMDEQVVLSATDNTFKSGKIGFLTYADSGFVAKNVRIRSAK